MENATASKSDSNKEDIKKEPAMPDSPEVVDIDDIVKYKNTFREKEKTNLVPYIVYMDADFNNVVKSKKRNDTMIWLLKIFGIVCLILALAVIFKKVFWK